MPLVKVVLHGGLKDRYESFEVGGKTAAEVIEGWSRQSGIDQSTVLSVVGYDTAQVLLAKLDEGVTELHIFPAMFGGGGIGKILIGAALIAIVVLQPEIGAVIGATLTASASTALLTVGIGMVIAGASELFMGSPSLSKEDDPEASKYIGSGRMSTAIGTPIGVGAGRIRAGGHLMSLQVNANDLVYGSFPATPT